MLSYEERRKARERGVFRFSSVSSAAASVERVLFQCCEQVLVLISEEILSVVPFSLVPASLLSAA